MTFDIFLAKHFLFLTKHFTQEDLCCIIIDRIKGTAVGGTCSDVLRFTRRKERLSMRVITGTARGRRLKTLEGSDVRPTTDRVKEAIFSVIQFDLEGRRLLDLFAGSGQMGIEALSRGAKEVVFVDSAAAAVGVVRENLKNCGLQKAAVVVQGDALAYLHPRAGRAEFDIAFLDPPYGKGILQSVLPAVASVMKPTGVIICESPMEETLPPQTGMFAIDREYRYGKIKVTFYRTADTSADRNAD